MSVKACTTRGSLRAVTNWCVKSISDLCLLRGGEYPVGEASSCSCVRLRGSASAEAMVKGLLTR